MSKYIPNRMNKPNSRQKRTRRYKEQKIAEAKAKDEEYKAQIEALDDNCGYRLFHDDGTPMFGGMYMSGKAWKQFTKAVEGQIRY